MKKLLDSFGDLLIVLMFVTSVTSTFISIFLTTGTDSLLYLIIGVSYLIVALLLEILKKIGKKE